MIATPRRLDGIAARGVLLAVAIGGCSPRNRTVEVELRNFDFSPRSVSVHQGDTVVWNNRDIVPHTITEPGGFDSGDVPAGGTFRWVAKGRGKHDYLCSLHPTMHGTIEVD